MAALTSGLREAQNKKNMLNLFKMYMTHDRQNGEVDRMPDGNIG